MNQMNVLNVLREELNIPYDCNYLKGIRITYGKEVFLLK